MRLFKQHRVVIQRQRTWVIHTGADMHCETCPTCADAAPMVTAEQAAALAGTSRRLIYRAVEAGLFHIRETPDGKVLVCLASLIDPIEIQAAVLHVCADCAGALRAGSLPDEPRP